MSGCETEVLVRGKDVNVNPVGSQAAAASLLLDLALFGVCCLAPLGLFHHK